jgi:hypothetical protein
MISQLIDRLSSLETIVSQLQTENAELKNEVKLDRHRRYMSELTTIMQHEREQMLEEKQNILIQSQKYQTDAKSSPSKSSPTYKNGTILISKDSDGDMMVSTQYKWFKNSEIRVREIMTIHGKVVHSGCFVDGKLTSGSIINGEYMKSGSFVNGKLEHGIKMNSSCISSGSFVNGEFQKGVQFGFNNDYCYCYKGDFVGGKRQNGILIRKQNISAYHDGKHYNGIDGIKYLDEYATYEEEESDDDGEDADEDEDEE